MSKRMTKQATLQLFRNSNHRIRRATGDIKLYIWEANDTEGMIGRERPSRGLGDTKGEGLSD